ncbi:MAG TPA: hypothetical protein VFV99_14090 [Kofleriaceae bacterium]|nr:hypothetical protein [Kofleriaceae bacterium]
MTGESGTKADAAAGGDGPAAGTFGAACTTVSDQSTECMSGVCTNTFDQLGHPVCSQKCTVLQGTDPTCPMGPSNQKCNMQGYCKP